jgi:ribulose-phosphate 3-epimerase
MIEIIPAILAKTLTEYQRKLKAVEPFTEWIQIDIVDNVYARNKTIEAKTVGSIRTNLKIEIQLMVEQIDRWLDDFVKLKPERIIFPIESSHDAIRLVNHLKQKKIQVGFSLEPKTPVERLANLVDKIDVALLLAVNPGFSGQHFAHNVIEKIRQLRKIRPDLQIEIDGGIEPDTAAKCAQVGATKLVSGSYIFENKTIAGESYNDKVRNSIESLKSAVQNVVPEEIV